MQNYIYNVTRCYLNTSQRLIMVRGPVHLSDNSLQQPDVLRPPTTQLSMWIVLYYGSGLNNHSYAVNSVIGYYQLKARHHLDRYLF